jgi:Protein of unknown function (DUF1761)
MSPTIVPTVASFVLAQAIGYVWYHPSVWGTLRLKAMKQSNPAFVATNDPRVYLFTAAQWIASSSIYSHLVSVVYGGSQAAWMDLCLLSLLLGVGFTAPPYLMAILFEQKNKVVSLIGFGYVVTVFLAMATCHAFL